MGIDEIIALIYRACVKDNWQNHIWPWSRKGKSLSSMDDDFLIASEMVVAAASPRLYTVAQPETQRPIQLDKSRLDIKRRWPEYQLRV